MTKNEIKKALYREKPVAKIERLLGDGSANLSAKLSAGLVYFFIPYNEFVELPGDKNNIPAQLLIRWLV